MFLLGQLSFIPFKKAKNSTFAFALVRGGLAGRRRRRWFRLRGHFRSGERFLRATGRGHGVRGRGIATHRPLGAFADRCLFASFAAFPTVVRTFAQG